MELANFYADEQSRIQSECEQTASSVIRAYGFVLGAKARVIAGRKVKIGTVVEIASHVMPSAFDRYGKVCHVRLENGEIVRYCDTANFEIIPDKLEIASSPLRCPHCKECRPVADFIYSTWESFGRRTVVKQKTIDVECVSCEAGSLTYSKPGEVLHDLTVSFIRGETALVYPLADALDELSEQWASEKAAELRKLHKVGVVKRTPRKKKEAVA